MNSCRKLCVRKFLVQIPQGAARLAALPLVAFGSFHSLRHSFTSAPANQNVASKLLMKLTGHKTEGEHQKYTHHGLANLRAAVEKSRRLAEIQFPSAGHLQMQLTALAR